MAAPVIALLTDFGQTDTYVGVMKGVILSRCPEARIVDLTHNVPPQDVRLAAFYLMTAAPHFPQGTIFVNVVDPGVGSERRVLWAENRTHQFLAPDNGLLSWIESKGHFSEIRQVSNKLLFAEKISRTFHGRDIFAPVAAELAKGLAPSRLGPTVDSTQCIPFPVLRRGNGKIQATVLAIDRFGNAITNLSREDVVDGLHFQFKGYEIGGLKHHYSEVEVGMPLAIESSFGFIELAMRNESFAARYQAKVGDPVDAITA